MTIDTEKQSDSASRSEESVTYLDQALWSQLQDPVDLESFGAAWIALLAQQISGVRSGVLVLIDGADRQLRPIASWPRGWKATAPVIAAAEAAVGEKKGVARAAQFDPGEGSTAPKSCQLAHPIFINSEPVGVIALELEIRPRTEITLALRQMQWGAAWVEKTIQGRSADQRDENMERLRTALDLLSTMLDSHGVEEAANAFVTELATTLKCDRVTIGAQRPNAMHVLALSHSAQFDKRMNIIHSLKKLMEEAVDQNAAIAMPQDKDGILVTREHLDFSAENDNAAILTTPFHIGDQRAGVLVLEREKDNPFSDQEIELVMAVAAFAGPIFEDRFAIEKPITAKISDWSREEVRKLLGPTDIARKMVFGSLAAFFLFCIFAFGTFRVAADTRLEGSVTRAVVAPTDGYVENSDIRPGDEIAAGGVLASMDTTDLRIERLHWLGEERKATLEYAKAISSRDRASLGVLKAQIEQAKARLELIDLQIERSMLRSPFDGVVVSGDLTQRIGASVGRGELLFEIAPLQDYRIIIEVDEKEIDFVEPGQTGRLILASMPSDPAPFTVRAITPVSSAEGGSNFFRVEAELLEGELRERLRPGMEGVAKIDVGQRRLIWIWTHDIYNWVRMMLWRWMP
ncbi:MAG: HlyD family efflux transporter periplasmic adaptor subunit [Marinicaulis sp.]|nr:HlyD family efflux transporter periplasmic adaptor subunit [Marinicaulis sp.]